VRSIPQRGYLSQLVTERTALVHPGEVPFYYGINRNAWGDKLSKKCWRDKVNAGKILTEKIILDEWQEKSIFIDFLTKISNARYKTMMSGLWL